MMWWSLTFKRLARNEIRRWTSILGNSENSRLKKFLFIVDAVLVFLMLFFCFLEETKSLFVRYQLDGRHDSTW